MYDYNCPDCNEAKLQSDKNARKINEIIGQVNQIVDNDIATTEYLLKKADEIVGNTADKKVNEIINEVNNEIYNIQSEIDNLVISGDGSQNLEVVQARGNFETLNDRISDCIKTSRNLLNTSNLIKGKNINSNGEIVDISNCSKFE